MRALPARRAGARARCCRRARPPRRCGRGRRGRRPRQAALGTALAARSTAATVLREGVEDRDDNETRFVWLARAADGRARRPPLRARGGERMEDIARLLGAGRRQPGLARALPGRVRAARDQPDEDRVAPAARAAGQLHVLRRPAGPGAASRAVARGGRGPARALRGGARARLLPGGDAPTADATAPARPPRSGSASDRHGVPTPSLHSGADRWRAQSHQSRWGPCRHQSTGGAGLTRGRVLVLNATYRADQRLHGAPRGGAAAEGEGRAARARRAGSCTPRARRSRGRS